ncbi:hypothetical protein BpHYR1_044499 [Brachionus plicatilis]|uniref:Uncharacterized protein n=1 Tax=Brachionus plicatilis TaxID=10195 RepID=A0A3M7SZ25_BRAPC|nr:hypothetical protein BpHYR1_044499 [Brachionus plicatilis]
MKPFQKEINILNGFINLRISKTIIKVNERRFIQLELEYSLRVVSFMFLIVIKKYLRNVFLFVQSSNLLIKFYISIRTSSKIRDLTLKTVYHLTITDVCELK